MKRNIIAIIKVLRLQSVLAMNLFIFLPIFIITKEFLFSLVQTLPFILMISGEIALNDCCDVEKDRINKPHRPLVRYNPNIKYVLSVAVVLILISGMLAIRVYYNSPFRILLFFIVVALLTLYNSKKAIIPFIKTFMTAIATVLSLLFAYSYLSMTIEDAFFLIAAFFYILGREFLMDIRDIVGDKKENYKTLAVVKGKKKVFLISCLCFGIATIFLGVHIFIDIYFVKSILFIFSTIVETLCLLGFYRAKASIKQNLYVILLWIPILIALIAQLL